MTNQKSVSVELTNQKAVLPGGGVLVEAGEDDSLLPEVQHPHLVVHLSPQCPHALLDHLGLVADPCHEVCTVHIATETEKSLFIMENLAFMDKSYAPLAPPIEISSYY